MDDQVFVLLPPAEIDAIRARNVDQPNDDIAALIMHIDALTALEAEFAD